MESEQAFKLKDIVIAAERDTMPRCKLGPKLVPKPLAVAWAVLTFTGMVENGGLQYFFENDWPEKLPYSLFVDALTHIGAREASQILARAVSSFPFPEPHLNRLGRNEYMNECRARDGRENTEFERLSYKLLNMMKEVDEKLVVFIRANLDFFPTAKALVTR